MTTDKQIIEKLNEIKESFCKLSNRYYMWSSLAVIYKQDLDPLIEQLQSEIKALESQSEVSYPREFVEWYSGMEFIKIDSAFKRWKRETGNQK